MLSLSKRITALEIKVNQLADRLRNNFDAQGLVDVKEGDDSSQDFQPRLMKLDELLDRSLNIIGDMNSPYVDFIDFGYDTYEFDDFEIVVEDLERRVSDFQNSVNEATLTKLNIKNAKEDIYALDKVKFLLKVGVEKQDINILLFKQFNDGRNDISERVELLLECGAELTYKYKEKTALDKAWDLARYEEVLPLIIQHSNAGVLNTRFHDNARPITRAFEEGKISLMEELFKNGAKAVPVEVKDHQICYKPTLLHQAVAIGDLKSIELFLEYGIDSNVAIQSSNMKGKFVEMVRKSVCGTVRGHTPLHEAIKFTVNNPSKVNDGLNIIKDLVRAGARDNIIDDKGLTVKAQVNMIEDKELKQKIAKAITISSKKEEKGDKKNYVADLTRRRGRIKGETQEQQTLISR